MIYVAAVRSHLLARWLVRLLWGLQDWIGASASAFVAQRVVE